MVNFLENPHNGHNIVCLWGQNMMGPVSIRKTVFPGMGIPMLKIRRPVGRLIFNMGIAIPSKTVFLIETAPWFFYEYTLYASVTGVLYRISWYIGLHYYNTWLYNIIYGILRSYFSLAYSSPIPHISVFVFTNESYLIHMWHYLYTLTAETYTESCKFIIFITWK